MCDNKYVPSVCEQFMSAHLSPQSAEMRKKCTPSVSIVQLFMYNYRLLQHSQGETMSAHVFPSCLFLNRTMLYFCSMLNVTNINEWCVRKWRSKYCNAHCTCSLKPMVPGLSASRPPTPYGNSTGKAAAKGFTVTSKSVRMFGTFQK